MNPKELWNELGLKINGITLVIDIINACSLRCPTCANGIYAPRKGIMSIDVFRGILDKLQSENKIRRVQFFAFSDPCLHPDLDKFVWECTKRKLPCAISTTLNQVNCDLRNVIESKPTEFRISFSGWKYARVHNPGYNANRAKANIHIACNLPRYPETKWDMFYLIYKDNRDELEEAKAWAERLGLNFISYPAILMPMEKIVGKNYSKQDRETFKTLLETPEEMIERMKLGKSFCYVQSKQIYMDARGEVYLCQQVYNERFRLGKFTNKSLRYFRRAIRKHPFCEKCKAAGAHLYNTCYADPVRFDNPIDPNRFPESK